MKKDETLIDKILKRNESEKKPSMLKLNIPNYKSNIPDYLLKLNINNYNTNLLYSINAIKSKKNYLAGDDKKVHQDFLSNLILTKNFFSAKVIIIILKFIRYIN